MSASTYRFVVVLLFAGGVVWAVFLCVGMVLSLFQSVSLGFGLSMSAGWCLAAVDSWGDADYFDREASRA